MPDEDVKAALEGIRDDVLYHATARKSAATHALNTSLAVDEIFGVSNAGFAYANFLRELAARDLGKPFEPLVRPEVRAAIESANQLPVGGSAMRRHVLRRGHQEHLATRLAPRRGAPRRVPPHGPRHRPVHRLRSLRGAAHPRQAPTRRRPTASAMARGHRCAREPSARDSHCEGSGHPQLPAARATWATVPRCTRAGMRRG